MNLAADLGGIFIVLGLTALAFAQIYKYETERTLRHRLDGDQVKGGNGLAGFVYFRSCSENVHTRRSRDIV